MKKKILMLILWIVLLIVFGMISWLSGEKNIGLIEDIASTLVTMVIERGFDAFNDLWDTTNWKISQRKLMLRGLIEDDTIIRISFAYLYRIKVGDKYLLVQNSRNTGKYQPVGGVYKLQKDEKLELKNLCHVMDDDKIPIDESSRNDYRLRMENQYLRRFMRRFDSRKAKREHIENVGREFKEELIENGILNWKKISYRYCGRHITELKFGEHFQIYELLLADIVELIPTQEQERDLRNLLDKTSTIYRFATADQIICLGMDIGNGQLHEWIADHTKNILQENEAQLMKVSKTGMIFSVDL